MSRGRVGATSTLGGSIVRIIVADAVARGLEARAVLDRFDVPDACVRDLEARVPANVLVRLWEGMPGLLDDASYGVHLGERAVATTMPLFGRLFATCDSVGDGLARMLALQRLLNDVHETELVTHGDVSAISIPTKHTPLPVPRHATEFVFTWLVTMVRQSTGADVRPLRARFEVSPPGDVAEHRRALGCPVEFDAEYNELVFSTSALALRLVGADPELREILDSHAATLMERLPSGASMRARVEQAVATKLETGATIDDVARALHVSVRTLQRYLRDEGTTFVDVLDHVRQRRAERSLRDRETSIAELSASLGFGDQSAFHKAFVRWTGSSPGAFRRRDLGR